MRSPAHCTSCNASVGAGGCPPSCQPISGHCRVRQSGHFLETGSLHLPLAALRRFPRRPDPNFFRTYGRAHGPCPTRCCVIEAGRTGSSAPANRSVGRGALTPPPDLHRTSCKNPVIAKPVTGVTGCGNPSPVPEMLFPSHKKRALPPGRAPFQTDSIHQKSALPTVRGCSSTSRMLLTPVRYMTIRSKPRPKPACLQVP